MDVQLSHLSPTYWCRACSCPTASLASRASSAVPPSTQLPAAGLPPSAPRCRDAPRCCVAPPAAPAAFACAAVLPAPVVAMAGGAGQTRPPSCPRRHLQSCPGLPIARSAHPAHPPPQWQIPPAVRQYPPALACSATQRHPRKVGGHWSSPPTT